MGSKPEMEAVQIPSEKQVVNVGGRPPAFTPEQYLKAVEKLHTLNDLIIANELKVGRSSVYRFRQKNKDIVEKAEKIISVEADTEYKRTLEKWEVFKNIRIVKKWEKIMIKRGSVNKDTMQGWLRGLWYICKHLKVHPAKLTLEQASEFNMMVREYYYNGEKDKIPYGCNYQNERETLRGFFMSVHNVSAQHLTNSGITKENLPGFGKWSKMAVSQDVRHKFEKTIKPYCKTTKEYWDTLNYCISGYATATRATALSEVELSNAIIFTKELWVFEVIDKGGQKWNKIITGHLLEKLRYGISQRFKISIDEIETELPKKTNQLFPFAYNKLSKMRDIIKGGLIDAGIRYICKDCNGAGKTLDENEKVKECINCNGSGYDFPPIHIWRHTFAQDALRASNWNYELVASIGGWSSTKILKDVYGEIGLDVKIRGVRQMMGIEEKEEEKLELRW